MVCCLYFPNHAVKDKRTMISGEALGSQDEQPKHPLNNTDYAAFPEIHSKTVLRI